MKTTLASSAIDAAAPLRAEHRIDEVSESVLRAVNRISGLEDLLRNELDRLVGSVPQPGYADMEEPPYDSSVGVLEQRASKLHDAITYLQNQVARLQHL